MTEPRFRKHISLNGRWSVAPGEADSPPGRFFSSVQVPGLVDLAEPAIRWKEFNYFWYRKEFVVPEACISPYAFLVFEQAAFGTAVRLNGKRIGGDIACYTSQEYPLHPHIRPGAANVLDVRVGAKETLPSESAVGNDYEKTDYIPGIWGEVSVVLHDNPRIRNVHVIPHIDTEVAEVRVSLENLDAAEHSCDVRIGIFGKESGKRASEEKVERVALGPGEFKTVLVNIPVIDMQLWSPASPFLYELVTSVYDGDGGRDRTVTRFGMREFSVRGGDFYLNGKKQYLRGSNIAFHRFLSDPQRGALPWDEEWIKRVLIDIPKEHNFNFFRNHLGQMYNRWYDIADEYGMLLQNEWQFWGVTGTKEQITREFTRWLEDNRNHPSIVIWDALNETRDEVVENGIIPEMKKLDPTRPWEPVDFIEDHPYMYSLTPVLNDRKFGFTRDLREIERLPVPSILNEFLWWWIDGDGNPAPLMKDITERWLGPDYTKEMLYERQSFLAQELVELFRRMRVDAIQPFVYLSNNDGPTANWFHSPIAKLQPKPILKTLKNAFSPFGISIELWDRHFIRNEERTIRVFVFNDTHNEKRGVVRFGFCDESGQWVKESEGTVTVPPVETVVKEYRLVFPGETGAYYVRAELMTEDRGETVAFSSKIAHVFDDWIERSTGSGRRVVVADSSRGDVSGFFDASGIPHTPLSGDDIGEESVVLVVEDAIRDPEYHERREMISRFVNDGGTLVLIEPEYGVTGAESIEVVEGLTLTLEKRVDKDKGGYDSYIFADNIKHPLWNGIEPEHLKMFNGGYGGEIVSQHSVTTDRPHAVHARCGVGLSVPVVMEMSVGKGRVIVSRLQLRERLVRRDGNGGLFDRRVDPVLRRYLINLIDYGLNKSG
jgi:beta-galactosidase